MKITLDTLKIRGSLLGPQNPLPMFKSAQREVDSSYDDSFEQDDKKLFAFETGFRVLPYKMQDSYSRQKDFINLKQLIIENEYLKASFLPDFGARLYSLIDKKTGRELLFSNSVFQPANLSTRNAWFSGGIEWNISQFGHSPLTCSPLFCAKLNDKENNEFLRVYEYERMRGIFFSIDFHLPSGTNYLSAYVKIVNPNDYEIPMYWWTNIAIEEKNDLRIFSESDQLIYIKPESNEKTRNTRSFRRGSIEKLPSLNNKDASFPMDFDFSSEYFFQNPKSTRSPWEAAVYNNGFTFFEKSSSSLLYRKMFCWGNHKGGRNWCDFLSCPSQGNYLEIQAGLAPTQIHGLIMDKSCTWDFTQIFGSTEVDSEKTKGPWKKARDYTKNSIDKIMDDKKIDEIHKTYQVLGELEVTELIHNGSGWGALEQKKGNRTIPNTLLFPDSTLGPDQKPWLDLIKTGRFDSYKMSKNFPTFQVDLIWKDLLYKSTIEEDENPWPFVLLAILLYENDQCDEAVNYWKKSINIQATSLAWRNLAVALKRDNKKNEAIEALKKSIDLDNTESQVHICRELLEILIEDNRFIEAWYYYSSLPEPMIDEERIIILAAQIAFELGKNDFLEKAFLREYAYIKEGDTRLVDLWYAYKYKVIADKRGILISDDFKKEIHRDFPPPKNIDFSMITRELP